MSDDKKIKQAALGMGFRRHHRFLGLVVFGYPLCAAKLERCRVQYLALCHRRFVSAAGLAVAAYTAVAARCGGRWSGWVGAVCRVPVSDQGLALHLGVQRQLHYRAGCHHHSLAGVALAGYCPWPAATGRRATGRRRPGHAHAI